MFAASLLWIDCYLCDDVCVHIYIYITHNKSVNIVESPYLKLLLEPRRRLSIVVVVNDDARAHFSAISSAVASASSILIL